MNLKGGYKIISLMAITLIAGAVGDDRTAITNEEILGQLDSLKEFLDESKQLKPILLRVKDSGNEVVMANLSKKAGEDIFYINADLVDASLNIMIKFAQNEETLEYYIDEAGYLYIADVDKVASEVAKAEEGTPVKMLGLDEDGELIKSDLPASGTKLYRHDILMPSYEWRIVVLSTDGSKWTEWDKASNPVYVAFPQVINGVAQHGSNKGIICSLDVRNYGSGVTISGTILNISTPSNITLDSINFTPTTDDVTEL